MPQGGVKMFGLILGIFCVAGLIQLRRFSRYRRHHWQGSFPSMHRWALRRVFSRLRTSPEQEKVLTPVVDEVVDAALGVRQELWNGPQVVTEVLKKDTFDAEALGNLYKAQSERLERARQAAHNLIATTFSTLTPEQRKTAAEMIEHRLAWRMDRRCASHGSAH